MFASDSKKSFERGKRSDSSFVKMEFMNTSGFESFIHLFLGLKPCCRGSNPGWFQHRTTVWQHRVLLYCNEHFGKVTFWFKRDLLSVRSRTKEEEEIDVC